MKKFESPNIAEILNYAQSVIDVNPTAKKDFTLLMERVDDEFSVYSMPADDWRLIESAIGNKYFPL
jgi:hypothetical protein